MSFYLPSAGAFHFLICIPNKGFISLFAVGESGENLPKFHVDLHCGSFNYLSQGKKGLWNMGFLVVYPRCFSGSARALLTEWCWTEIMLVLPTLVD